MSEENSEQLGKKAPFMLKKKKCKIVVPKECRVILLLPLHHSASQAVLSLFEPVCHLKLRLILILQLVMRSNLVLGS